jgi:hypothetical protein
VGAIRNSLRTTSAVVAALGALVLAAPALANHSLTELQSTGPAGGNGLVAANFRGASADGTRVFLQTSEPLVSLDTDGSIDVYERSNGTTTLLSSGPAGGNAANSATFLAASRDGSKLFFRTAEKLVSSDTDSAQDIYQRSNGTTTLVSTGPSGGNGSFNVVFDRISSDGSTVLFDTSESLVGTDADTFRDVYQRSGGTTSELSVGPVGGNGDLDATFAGASRDTGQVFFTTDESLASTDFDGMQDVYERSGGATTHLSIGPAGGNGNADFSYDAFFAGVAANGSKSWIKTDEALTYDDTDTFDDVYELSAAGISRISFGPSGGNGDAGAFFDGASEDGSRVFLDTIESLAPADTDSSYDVYERSAGQVTLLSTGPNGGSGPFFAAFRGATPDGSHVFFETYESLTAADTDANQDVYDRSGGQTTLVSTGPDGGSGDVPASFQGSSIDGSRVFFGTAEGLVAGDTDDMPDAYERFAGATTLISTGPTGLNGPFPATYDGISEDGTRAFFETAEPLVAVDTDAAQDVYGASVVSSYARPKGASPFRVSLVPAYRSCTAPNRNHGAPLAYPSCNPPVETSGVLTIGSPDANTKAANSTGYVSFTAVPGNASTLADEADAKIKASITDVRRKSDLGDYTGQLQLVPTLRITDKLNGSSPVDPATVSDLDFPVTVPCATTVDTNVGSTCSIATTADSVLPGTIAELKRTILQLGQVKVLDGGADGLAATPDNSPFAIQGVFVP